MEEEELRAHTRSWSGGQGSNGKQGRALKPPIPPSDVPPPSKVTQLNLPIAKQLEIKDSNT